MLTLAIVRLFGLELVSDLSCVSNHLECGSGVLLGVTEAIGKQVAQRLGWQWWVLIHRFSFA